MIVTREVRPQRWLCSSLWDLPWEGRLRKGKRANVNVQPPGKDFGKGRFNSSSPVSLLRHTSPLNKIDYWFLLSSPALPSIRLFSLEGAERKKNDGRQNRITYCTQMVAEVGGKPSSWPCHSSQKGVMQKFSSSYIDQFLQIYVQMHVLFSCIDLVSVKRGKPVW